MSTPVTVDAPELLDRPPSRRRATITNLLFSYTGVVMGIIRNLVMVPLYLHYIDFREYGAWLATGGILGYLMIVDFGLTGVTAQQAAIAYGQRNRERLQWIVGTGLFISLGIAVLPGLCSLIAVPFLPAMLGVTGEAVTRLSGSFVIVAVTTGLGLFGFAASGLLRSFQRPLLPGLIETFFDVVSIALTALWIVRGWGLYAIAWGLAVRNVGGGVGCGIACLFVCRRQLGLRLRVSAAGARELLRLSGFQFGASVASKVLAASDPLLVGVMLGPVAAGCYALTTRAHDLVRLLTSRVAIAASPSLGHIYGAGEHDRLRSVLLATTRIQAAVACIGMAGVIAFNQPFVSVWAGPNVFAGMAVTVLVALWGIGAQLGGGVAWETMYATGRIPLLTKVAWMEVAIRVPLALGLMYLIGLPGVALAALAGQFVAIDWLLVRSVIRFAGFARNDLISLAIDLAKLLLLPLVFGAAWYVLARQLSGWTPLLWQAPLFLLLATALVLLTNSRTREAIRMAVSRGKAQ